MRLDRRAAAVAVMAALFVSAGSARPALADDDHEHEREDEGEDHEEREDEHESEHESEHEHESEYEHEDEDESEDHDGDDGHESCEDGSGGDGSSSSANGKRGLHGARGPGRMDHDVLVRLAVRKRPRRPNVRVRLRVVNQGRQAAEDVTVELFADDPAGTPLWSDTVSLRRRGKKRWRLSIPRADVAGKLIATATIGDGYADEDPGDNVAERTFRGASPADDAARGAALYGDLCAGCHGADGTGSAVTDEDISREDWCEIYEAFFEGEDGMPTFRDLTRQDARDIAAFLRNPDTPPSDPPPSDPPPSDPPPSEPPPSDPPPSDPPGNTTPTYTANVKSILDSNCIGCHGASTAFAGIRLHTYTTAKANAAVMVDSVQAGRMPTSGRLPAADVTTLADWLAGGTPE